MNHGILYRILDRIKRTLSNDPYASYSRTMSAISALVFLGLDIYTTIKAGGVSGMDRDVLIGQAFFVSSIYGCGKVGESLQSFSPKAVELDETARRLSKEAENGK